MSRSITGAKGNIYNMLFMDTNCTFLGVKNAIRESGLDVRIDSIELLQNTSYRVCGSTEYLTKASPISLILKDNLDLNRDQSIVSFAINPGVGGKLFTWKGSSDAPLLVYDPMHKGSITAASQLFGNWTFGGKRVASLTVGETAAWRDGYEALASLDGDEDGKVSGEELKDLALWFDENRNAISEPGEVQSLESHGVVELFFNPDQRDEVHHTISASHGFTRVVNGERGTGKSVDWYAESADSLEALLGTIKPSTSGSSAATKPSGDESRETKRSPLGLSGEWLWEGEGDDGDPQKPAGRFIISETGDKEFVLISISLREAKVVPTGETLLSLTSVDMVGRVRTGLEVEFETTSDVPGVKLESKATVSEDGKTLRGYTVASGKDASGSDKNLRYSWVASKVKD